MKRYMDGVLKYLAHWKIYIRIMAKWTGVALIVGILCGIAGGAGQRTAAAMGTGRRITSLREGHLRG